MNAPSFPFFFHVLHAVERVFVWFSCHPEQPVYDSADFAWTRELESHWRDIRSELERLIERADPIPSFQEISPEQTAITQDDRWKAYVLYAYGARANRNCAQCPRTAAAVERIPGMKTAFFSILAPGKRIPPHRGPYKGLLRCHLGLVVPEPQALGLRVGARHAAWREGAALVFDDTFEHEVWNESAAPRVVLFIDFTRPMRQPLAWLNETVLRLIVRSPYGRRSLRRFARWYESRGIRADV